MIMTPAPLYCSEKCKSAALNRSFDTCPRCNMRWDGKSRENNRHYKNTAWVICDTCSRENGLCAICGASVEAKDFD